MKQSKNSRFSNYASLLFLAGLLLFNSIFTPNFFRLGTLQNSITQLCPTILCGMGMTLVISTGGIDISVGSLMALSGVIMAKCMERIGIFPGILLGIGFAVLIGMFTGIMVGKLKLQAMVITLGLMLGVRGAAQVLCDGRDIYFNTLGERGELLSDFGTLKFFNFIPVQLLPIFISVLLIWILIKKTTLGVQIQAVGDSIKSSNLVGIHTNRVFVFVYGLSGFFAAIAGIMQAAKVSVAAGSSLGQLAELDAIAAVVIGGTPMSGGRARVLGTVLGAMIMQCITLTCVMNNIPDQYAQVVKAMIIVFAVYIQRERS
jgi:inner membrane ABC transporter permease protein ytfT